MTPPPWSQPEWSALLISADLRVDVDGVHAQVSGDGDQLRVTTDHPMQLLRATVWSLRPIGRSTTRHGLDQLRAQGLTLTVAGPKRDLVLIGAGAGRVPVKLVVPRPIAAAALIMATLATIVRIRRR